MTFPSSSPSAGRHHVPTADVYGSPGYHPDQGWSPPPGPSQGGWPEPAPAPAPQSGGWQAAEPPAPPAEPVSRYDAGGEPSKEDLLWANVRLQVATRLKSINATHCYEAFDRYRTKNALSPHGVALFFASNDAAEPDGYKLQFLVRLFLAGPESDNLPQILGDLTKSVEANIARATARRRRWHPRGPEDSIVNAGNMDMPDEATYLGVGVSTLDTDEINWDNAVRAVQNQPWTASRPRTVFDLPGRCIVQLADGTEMLVVRDPNRRVGDNGITSNKSLDPIRMRYWNPNSDVAQRADPSLGAAWAQLATLHRTLDSYLNGEPRR